MKTTKQTKDQSILQHGLSVWKYTKKILISDFEGMVLPKWFIENSHWFINQIDDWDDIQAYTIWHDIGKCFCLEEKDGKRHFPNHAEISEKKFKEFFPDNDYIAELIGLDMIMHTEKFEQIIERNLPIKTLCALYIAALAEINSNAELFGGFTSESFKIKLKRLDRTGKKILSFLEKHVDKHIYVLVRDDLPPEQKVVQCGHALFELAKKNNEHASFVVLSGGTEQSLKNAMSHLVDNGISFKIFREPMSPYSGSITAIATEPLDGSRRLLLRGYNLLRIS